MNHTGRVLLKIWKVGFLVLLPIIPLIFVFQIIFKTIDNLPIFIFQNLYGNFLTKLLIAFIIPLFIGWVLRLPRVRSFGLCYFGKIPVFGSFFKFIFSDSSLDLEDSNFPEVLVPTGAKGVFKLGFVSGYVYLPGEGDELVRYAYVTHVASPVALTGHIHLVDERILVYTGNNINSLLLTVGSYGASFRIDPKLVKIGKPS